MFTHERSHMSAISIKKDYFIQGNYITIKEFIPARNHITVIFLAIPPQ
jgi:hypothetical protein